MLVAALPLQAQPHVLDAVEELDYEGIFDTYNLKFSWKTIDDEVGVKIQYKDGVIHPTWTTGSTDGLSSSQNRSSIWVSAPTYPLAGLTFKFRLSVISCQTWSQAQPDSCESALATKWAKIEVSF